MLIRWTWKKSYQCFKTLHEDGEKVSKNKSKVKNVISFCQAFFIGVKLSVLSGLSFDVSVNILPVLGDLSRYIFLQLTLLGVKGCEKLLVFEEAREFSSITISKCEVLNVIHQSSPMSL